MAEQYLNIVTRREVAIPRHLLDKFPGLTMVFRGHHYDNYCCDLECSLDDNEINTLDAAMENKDIIHYSSDGYSAE